MTRLSSTVIRPKSMATVVVVFPSISDRSSTPSDTVVMAASVRSGVISEMRSEEHTSELQSLMRISYAVFCLKNKHYTHNRTSPTWPNTKHNHTTKLPQT